MEQIMIEIRAQSIALTGALACIMMVLSEEQRRAACELISKLTSATDTLNAEFAAFTVGEEGTYQLQIALDRILKFVRQMESVKL